MMTPLQLAVAFDVCVHWRLALSRYIAASACASSDEASSRPSMTATPTLRVTPTNQLRQWG